MVEREQNVKDTRRSVAERDSWTRRNHVGWSSAWLLVPPGVVLLAGLALALPTSGLTRAEATQSTDEELACPDGCSNGDNFVLTAHPVK